MIKKGISVNGKHSCGTFGLRLLSRSIGSPPRDDHTERVPFSNVTYDFDSVFGKSSYCERMLKYRFEFIDMNLKMATDRLVNILNWLHWSGRLDLHDDMLPGYHFSVREPEVLWSENHGIYTFDVNFKAEPAIIPNPERMKYNEGNVVIPDVTEDGLVDSDDASAILTAYSNLSVGNDSDLTERQKLAADADMDGIITADDASLVSAFYSRLATGRYSQMTLPQAWAAYLTELSKDEGKVY